MTGLRRVGGAIICAALGACTSAPPPLRLGTTTTVEQSGALADLLAGWTGAKINTIIAPSGQILRSAAAGDLDVVITHAPSLERSILAGRASLRCALVSSRFGIVGPAADPAHVAQASTAADAFRRIAAAHARFISRGDSSGTHVKELSLWASAGVAPQHHNWYVESGTDQAATLHLAEERDAYALADLPTLARLSGLTLHTLFTEDTSLTNPYTLYVIRAPASHPAAREFAEWAMGAGRTHILARTLSGGRPAFVTRDTRCTAPE
jgi:tungstate transport system substrate-binding protein